MPGARASISGVTAALADPRRQQHADREADREAARADVEGRQELVLTRPAGRPVSPRAATAAFRATVQAGEAPRLRRHDVRRTYATMLRRSAFAPAKLRAESQGA